jgi:hypothetical protein
VWLITYALTCHMTGRMDELFGRILSIMGRFMGTAITRKRNRTEQSLTTSRARPDFIVLLANTLLLKGEDKPEGGDMDEAKKDLVDKVKGWSARYHGTVGAAICMTT